jgi:hypothetical protein
MPAAPTAPAVVTAVPFTVTLPELVAVAVSVTLELEL